MSTKKILLTAQGLKELQEQLRVLKEEKRVEIAARLKEAISYWDLRENSEYETARSDQALIELQISELEETLKNVEIVTEKKKGGVAVGSTVTLRSLDTDEKTEETFRIVGSKEADILEWKLSNESPVGASLIGKLVGDMVKGKSPAGPFSFEVIAIK